MAKVTFKTNNVYNKIFEDLEKYHSFCRDYGYRFDERDLYNNRSNVYKQFSKYLTNRPVKNMWDEDGEK